MASKLSTRDVSKYKYNHLSRRTVPSFANTMPSVLSTEQKPPPLDPEWANSLVGLSLLVPDSWWPGYDGEEKNHGVILSVDFTNTKQRFFNVDVDGNVYCMRYAAVFHFADSSQRGFDRYRLPRHPVTSPEGEVWTCPSQQNQGFLDTNAGSISNEEEEAHVRYMLTDPVDWTCVDDGSGRWIDPVPYTGGNEHFTVDITDEEVVSFKDRTGDIAFNKVLEWTLPRFGRRNDVTLFEWQAARMRNYMIHIMNPNPINNANANTNANANGDGEYEPRKPNTPKYYNPKKGLVITADHVARFYGTMMCRAITGNKSILDIWLTRSIHKANAAIKECMPQDAFRDLCRCMHFADDWEENDLRWNETCDDTKEDMPEETARHR